MTEQSAKKQAGESAGKSALAHEERVFRARWDRHKDELRQLFNGLYQDEPRFQEFAENLHRYYLQRDPDLRARDIICESYPEWYKQNNMMGMMFYINNFAKNMEGVRKKIPYLKESGINYIHLMPFLKSPKGRSDGGYAVADFRCVQPELGTIEDLRRLTRDCHDNGINICMDFVMNHTSEDHEWAKKAKAGDPEYQARYFFYDNDTIPKLFEQTVPQVFPTTAPGNFTWLDDVKKYVMTSFYPYQWDLNYRNPVVFCEMMYNFLFLANCGIDIIRLDAVPYIWKELYTTCRNLPQVHTLVRMMRIVGEIVCPGVLLLGEVVMEPAKVVPYFGTVEKPECHMLYNVTTMATTWHTVATRQTHLLKKQLDIVNALPKDYVFLNYLRCHDDIGWGLDFDTLREEGINETAHKNYLNDFFRGYAGSSNSRGELYNYDPVTQDGRFCGTTASMCGIERAGFEQNEGMMQQAIRLDVMLHACLFMESGIPVIYSGDEVAQVNDYSYKNDPDKAADSRYIHRGPMDWKRAERRKIPGTVEYRVYTALQKLEEIRRTEKVFVTYADCYTLPTWEDAILCIVREFQGEKIIGLFNYSETDRMAWIDEEDGQYQNLITGEIREAKAVGVPAYGFCYLKRIPQKKDGE